MRYNALDTVYYGSGYIDVVRGLAEDSMNAAVEEIKALPGYAENGEVTIISYPPF